MATGRPLLVDPRELARRGGAWAGPVPAASLARVARVLGPGVSEPGVSEPGVSEPGVSKAEPGAVDVRLTFEFDGEGRCRVLGSARMRARVFCQRCVRSVERELAARIDVVVLDSEAEARALTPRYDTCVLVDRKISIDALIEDDLLLSVPEYGCERSGECPHAPAMAYPAAGVGETAGNGPFAVLARLAPTGSGDKRRGE